MIAAFRLVAANDHARIHDAETVDLRSALTRHQAEAWIERLIAMLDDLDGDVDSEPWLGAGGSDDREEDAGDEREEDAGDEREKDCDSEEGDGDVDAEREPGDTTMPETEGAGWENLSGGTIEAAFAVW